jgi:hypothetical protein
MMMSRMEGCEDEENKEGKKNGKKRAKEINRER